MCICFEILGKKYSDKLVLFITFRQNHVETCRPNVCKGRENAVQTVVKNLGSNKAPRIDVVGDDCVKWTCIVVVPLLCRCFFKPFFLNSLF